MKPISFEIQKELPNSLGRAGVLKTPHGDIQTPAFVAVGTKGTVKGLTPDQIRDTGVQTIIANTYHLYLNPDPVIIKSMGGLHKAMGWSGPLMTDSGGFQVFSLGVALGKGISKISKGEKELLLADEGDEDGVRATTVKIDPNGVMFRDHLSGDAHYFTPEKSIDIQHNLGADIIFAFDECTAPNESDHYQAEALDRTHRWAKQSLEYHKRSKNSKTQALFGIVQGGRNEKLRKESARFMAELRFEGPEQSEGFDGFGIGGSFEKEDMDKAVEWVNSILPKEKPRHLLGIGEPMDLFMAVEKGCDLFDCVAPTRIGRNGGVYTKDGKINLFNKEYRGDLKTIDDGCGCYACKNFTRGYVAHLFHSKEMLAGVLASIHNIYFITHMVAKMREEILNGDFHKYKEEFLQRYYGNKFDQNINKA